MSIDKCLYLKGLVQGNKLGKPSPLPFFFNASALNLLIRLAMLPTFSVANEWRSVPWKKHISLKLRVPKEFYVYPST